MNQSFNFQRFGLLLKLHLSEHLKSYVLGIGVLFGVLILLFLPTVMKTYVFHESIYRSHGMIFGFTFCGAGAWFASEAFKVVSTPVQGIPYLTLPASQLEKFLVSFLMILSFVPIFIGIFYTIEGICFSIINARLPLSSPHYKLLDLTSNYLDIQMRYLTLITPSFFLLGSIYFSKLPFVKTAVIAFSVYLFTVLVLNDLLTRQLFPVQEHFGVTLFHEITFLKNRRWYTVTLAGFPQVIINSLLLLAIPSLWYIAYIRFKEKEI